MRAGKLFHRITLLRRGITTDSEFLEDVETYSPYATDVPADKVDRSGNEGYYQGVNVPTQFTVFKIRYRSDVQELDRVNHSGKLYEIDFIKELGRREGLELSCRLAR